MLAEVVGGVVSRLAYKHMPKSSETPEPQCSVKVDLVGSAHDRKEAQGLFLYVSDLLHVAPCARGPVT